MERHLLKEIVLDQRAVFPCDPPPDLGTTLADGSRAVEGLGTLRGFPSTALA
jgi:hypothetical protein